MYLYKVGFYSYEENSYAILSHENKFESLDDFMLEAVTHVLEKIAKNVGGRIYIGPHGPEYEYIHKEVIEYLINNFGFKEVDYQATWSVFGWASLTDNSSWEYDRDDQLQELTERLPKDLVERLNKITKERYDMRMKKRHDRGVKNV